METKNIADLQEEMIAKIKETARQYGYFGVLEIHLISNNSDITVWKD